MSQQAEIERSRIGSGLDRRDWLSIAGLSAFAAVFVASTWQRWSTPLVDVGRELYTAWAISHGASLYQDIWLPRGPLSSYWNGLLFAVFGTSMLTLAIANLLILAAGTALLYSVIRRHYGTTSAALAIFLLLSVFAFARYDTMGNYNFVLPYAHEVTHGLVLSLLTMAFVLRSLRDGGVVLYALLAGLSLGLVLLTKQEIAVAAVVATAATVASEPALPLRQRTAFLGWIGLGAAVPLLIALVALGTTPFAMMWNISIGEVVRDNPFYRGRLGLDRPLEYAGSMGLATLVLALELLVVVVASRWLRSASNARIIIAVAVYVLLHLLLVAVVPVPAKRYWLMAPKLLPPLVALVMVSSLVQRIVLQREGQRDAFLCWLSTFAAGMLLKLGLQPRIHYYGFVQALPAAMVLVILLVGIVPHGLGRFRVDSRFVRAAMACLIVGFGLYSISVARRAYAPLIITTGAGADAFRGPQSYGGYERILTLLSERLSPDDTLLVLPEGVLFNYLLRVRSPTPHISFLPLELKLTGEHRIVEDLDANPPDHVLLLYRDMNEYGVREFGQPGYGDQIIAWLREHYDWPKDATSRQPILLRRGDGSPGTGDASPPSG